MYSPGGKGPGDGSLTSGGKQSENPTNSILNNCAIYLKQKI